MGVIKLKPRVEKNNKVSLLPNCFVFLLKMYKQKQDEIRQRKINFLEQQALEYFETVVPMPEIKVEEVDIPYFLKFETACKRRSQFIHNKVAQVMLEVITNGRVNECYEKRKKELKRIKK
jgi:hypothetical protein